MFDLPNTNSTIRWLNRSLPSPAVKKTSTQTQNNPDPVAFAKSIGFVPDPWQETVLRCVGSPSSRMLLNCSRQAGKSSITALAAVNVARVRQESLILLVSPSLRQSSELFRKVADWIERAGLGLTEDNKLSCTLDNGSRILSLPSSEATIRGFSKATLIIEDEASRVTDALYYSIRPMLAIGGGGLILMSTPFGKRGHFHQEWAEGGDQWQRIEVHATDVPRITPEFLEQERRSLGEWWFSQEYMCQFRDAIDSLFSYELINASLDSSISPLFANVVHDTSGITPLFGDM